MRYGFEAKITGYYHVEIEADSLEEAKEKGRIELNYIDENIDDLEAEYLCITDDSEEESVDYYYEW